MVAEISYHYTYEDGDGHTNVIYDGAWGEFNYEVSEEGQIQAVTECADAVKTLGKAGLGICYWEPAWLPVPAKSDKARKKLWEKYGSGWASSYAGDYDPDDAGENYGGDAWDNQALFDFTGHPLKSLGMFQKIRE
ncbi:MAG: glycosyl hydrolase 53 family protein [Lachnospiraceae bacterium]|nr:glycosyl hydrolase 53 family protein [Lachnospiraceae bacterium]